MGSRPTSRLSLCQVAQVLWREGRGAWGPAASVVSCGLFPRRWEGQTRAEMQGTRVPGGGTRSGQGTEARVLRVAEKREAAGRAKSPEGAGRAAQEPRGSWQWSGKMTSGLRLMTRSTEREHDQLRLRNTFRGPVGELAEMLAGL